MDQRTSLEKNSILHFPGMDCVIDACTGRGSNAIAYTGSYRDYQHPELSHLVLIRELFPYDQDGGITRAADGSLIVAPSSQSLYDFNKMTFERGNKVHIRLAKSFPAEIDVNINTFEYNNTLYSLLGFTGGRTLDKDLERHESASDKKEREAAGRKEEFLRIIRIVKGALDVLQSFHEAGYLHLDISPDNILLIGEAGKERVTLIDYNSVHTLQEIREGHSVYYSTKEGYTAPEVRMGRIPEIRERTDLYSVTAVLYRCLTGKVLTPLQLIGSSPVKVTVKNSVFLEGCPESALSLLGRILRKGLAVTPRRRYQTCAHMMADLTELEDRVNGRGITHWALWEKGRKHIRRTLQENIALNYILDEKKIYPIYAETEDGRRISLLEDSWMEQEAQETPAAPVLLLGGGGMGKTTALFRLSCKQQGRYRPDSTAIYYVSLYGYRDKNSHYICDHLLESLKFKPHTDSMESARRELMQLLDMPMPASPPFLILLDGFNEAAGDTGPLLEEIHTLSRLAGVQIILTGRSDPGDPAFRKLVLCRLEQAEVRKILADEGILPPENMEVFDLLSFPLLLSMYIRTVRNGEKQLSLGSREQLLQDYFDAILEKERRELPADRNSYMGIDAAVRYLLPEIAALAVREQRALMPQDLYPLTEKCFKELSRRALTVVYPDWIGHSSELRLGTGSADEWYGQAVLDILWRRLGLLVRDEDGNFRIPHQILEEYLAEKSADFHEKFDREKRRQRTWRGFIAMSVLLAVMTAFGIYFFSTSTKLARQQQELLLSESKALASSSEAKLKAGDREGALEDALAALPSDGNDRPYTASAERALADALYLYDESEYHPVRRLHLENDLVCSSMNADGSVFVGVDEYGKIFCLDCKNGNTLWESAISDVSDDNKDFDNRFNSEEYPSKHYVFPVLRILEKTQTVFCAGQKDEAVLLSLADGKELWRLSYEEIPNNSIYRILLAEVSHDEKTLAIGFTETKQDAQSEEKEHSNILLLFDMSTGKMKGQYDIFPDQRSLYCSFNGECVFTEDDNTFISVLSDVHERVQYIIPFDMTSESAGTPARISMQGDGNGRTAAGILRAEKDVSLSSAEAEDEAAAESGKEAGTYYYLCVYDTGVTAGNYTGTVTICFLPDGADTPRFEKVIGLIGEPNRLPYMYIWKGNLVLLNGNDIVGVGQSGEVVRESSEKKIIGVKSDDDPALSDILYPVFEDGGSGKLFLPGMTVYVDPNVSPGFSDNLYEETVGSGKRNVPFVLIPQTEHPQEALLCEYNDRRPLREIPLPDLPAALSNEFGDCFPITGTDRFLVLYDVENENRSELEDSCFYDHYGFVYSAEGEILDRFSFTAPVSVPSEDLSFTKDGRKMLSGHWVYDLDTHELLDLETVIPPDTTCLYLRSSVMDSSIFSAMWEGGTLYIYENGIEKEKSVYDGAFSFADMIKDLEYNKTFDFEDMTVGKNGMVILMGTDGEEISYRQVEGKPVDYYLVWSGQTGKWLRIPDASSSKGFPAVCAAEKKNMFAAFDRDHRLIIYDGETGEILNDYLLNIDVLDIEEMRFILDDEYLVIRSEHRGMQYSFVRLSDGETVFTYRAPEEYVFGQIMLTADSEQNRLYLYNGLSNMTGLCIDTDSWETLFEISGMRCVPGTSTCLIETEISTGTGYLQYPLYTREDMIRMGRELLGE